jgi:hypothetical protein
MDTELLSNVNGNVQSLRKMWSIKAQEKDEPLRPTLIPSKSQQKDPPKVKLPVLKIPNDTNNSEKTNKSSTVIPNNESKTFD